MSNFSQFFPAGSGGSGGGSGINSYAPFLVTSTSGNPVGYDVTTGIYTNPVDDSVWIKTGKTLIDSSNTYPNATGVTDHFTQQAATGNNSSNWRKTVWNGTQLYALEHYNSSATDVYLKLVDPTTLEIGSSGITLSFGGVTSRTVAWDPNASAYITFPEASPRQVVKYDAANSNPVAYTITGGTPSVMQQSTVIGNDLYMRDGLGNLWIMDLTTNAFTGPIAIPDATLGISSITAMDYDAVNDTVWFSSSSGVDGYSEYNYTTWAATGNTILRTQPTGPPSGTSLLGMAIGGDAIFSIGFVGSFRYKVTKYSITGITEKGDVVARTSAMGDGQPLFIKLK